MATKKPTTKARKKTSVRISKKKRGISKFQALAVAAVLAIVGVVVVVATRASGTPPYQYSQAKYCVSGNTKESTRPVQNCINTSAEALVFRLYKGLYGKRPDDGGYVFWTQKFAGDRVQPSKSSLVVERVGKMGSDTDFVKTLYANMFDRSATAKELSYWTAKLKGNKAWTRQQVAVNFAISKEAINKNQDAFSQKPDAFLVSAPVVTVVQTAAKKQYERFDKMYKDYAGPATRDKEVAQNALNTAKAQLTAAGKTANKNAPSSSDLNAIAGNQTNAGNAYGIASSRADAATAKAAAAKKLFDEAKALGDYATDIGGHSAYGLKQIAARYRTTKSAATAAKSYAASAKARLNDIAKKYVVAEKKYNDSLARAGEGEGAGTNVECSQGVNPATGTCNIPARADGRCNSIIGHGRSVQYNAGQTKKTIVTWSVKLLCDKNGKPAGVANINQASTTVKVTPPKAPAPSHSPKEPGNQSQGSSGGSKKTCPNGWIPRDKYCWNGVVRAEVLKSRSCPAGSYVYKEHLLGGTTYKQCRTRVDRAGY